jgi:hypothetical protein
MTRRADARTRHPARDFPIERRASNLLGAVSIISHNIGAPIIMSTAYPGVGVGPAFLLLNEPPSSNL